MVALAEAVVNASALVVVALIGLVGAALTPSRRAVRELRELVEQTAEAVRSHIEWEEREKYPPLDAMVRRIIREETSE